MHKPYYLGCLALAGVIVWACPDTWSWTFRLTWRKAAVCAGLLWASLAVLATQEYNPFIYFMF
jgi:alginate O-acetyltransferase complex protein AlgI